MQIGDWTSDHCHLHGDSKTQSMIDYKHKADGPVEPATVSHSFFFRRTGKTRERRSATFRVKGLRFYFSFFSFCAFFVF